MNNLSNPEIDHEKINAFESAEKFLTDAGIINEGSLEQKGVTSGDYLDKAVTVVDSSGGNYIYAEVKTQKSGYDWETANYLVDLSKSRYMHLGGRDTFDQDYGVYFSSEKGGFYVLQPFKEGDPVDKPYDIETSVEDVISAGNWLSVES
ncbi:hypothetical protein LDC_1716 [sediment metagenome]|uniref:Uncharacterized protein n=1 Tax=sediment metagenome TaxID=749907 RepID=D9PJK5_9ZZZZ